NVRVNAIGPGPINNRMIRSIETQLSPDAPDAVRDGFSQLIAMKRYGTNEEVANLALFLASDESSYCTGSIHMIDGGFTAAWFRTQKNHMRIELSYLTQLISVLSMASSMTL